MSLFSFLLCGDVCENYFASNGFVLFYCLSQSSINHLKKKLEEETAKLKEMARKLLNEKNSLGKLKISSLH